MYTVTSDEIINNVLNEVTRGVKDVYGSKLKEVVLYGSYAIGKNDDESDIDLMVLVDAEESELRNYDKQLNRIISDIGYRYIKVISLVDMSYEKFYNWVDAIPFYMNVKNEGIVIYEQ